MTDIAKIKAEYELKIKEAELGNTLETELDVKGVRVWARIDSDGKRDTVVYIVSTEVRGKLTASQVGEILSKFPPDEEYQGGVYGSALYPTMPARIHIYNSFQGSEMVIEYLRNKMRIRISDIPMIHNIPDIDQYFKTYYRPVTDIELDTYGRRAEEIGRLLAYNFRSPNVIHYYGGYNDLICAQETQDIIDAFKKHYEEERQGQAAADDSKSV